MNWGLLSVVMVLGKQGGVEVSDHTGGNGHGRQHLGPFRMEVVGYQEEALVLRDAMELTTNVHPDVDVNARPSDYASAALFSPHDTQMTLMNCGQDACPQSTGNLCAQTPCHTDIIPARKVTLDTVEGR